MIVRQPDQRRTLARLVGCIVVGALGVACGPATSSSPTDAPTTTKGAVGGSPTTTGAANPTDATVAPTAPVAVPAALEVGATLVGGGEIDLADYAGKALALWFWAPT